MHVKVSIIKSGWLSSSENALLLYIWVLAQLSRLGLNDQKPPKLFMHPCQTSPPSIPHYSQKYIHFLPYWPGRTQWLDGQHSGASASLCANTVYCIALSARPGTVLSFHIKNRILQNQQTKYLFFAHFSSDQ